MGETTFARMERLYAPQVPIYDLTRRLSLIGRKHLLDRLPLRAGMAVLEVGCGTGWVLVQLARREPNLRLFGLDASRSMLARAHRRLARLRLPEPARLVHGLAEQLDAAAMFARPEGFDLILFSYCLSMVEQPEEALARALYALAPGGTLAAVDFGALNAWPALPAAMIRKWLALFGAAHRPQIGPFFRQAAEARGGDLEFHILAGGYAELHILRTGLNPAARTRSLAECQS